MNSRRVLNGLEACGTSVMSAWQSVHPSFPPWTELAQARAYLDRALAGPHLAGDLSEIERLIRSGVKQPQDRAPGFSKERTPDIWRHHPCTHNGCECTQNGYTPSSPILTSVPPVWPRRERRPTSWLLAPSMKGTQASRWDRSIPVRGTRRA